MIKQQRYQAHFFISLLLHLFILAVLVVSFEFSQPIPVVKNSDRPNEAIQAMIFNPPPPTPVKVVQKVTPPEPETVKPPIKQEVIPIVKPTPPKTKAIVIPDKNQKKLEEERIQKQLLAELKKETEQKKVQQQKDIQKALEKEMQEMKALALQKQMREEKERIRSEREVQVRGVVDKYKALILQAISQNWLIPPSVNKKLSAELLIRLAPGGAVLDVQLLKGSGDDALDRSARAAVYKASPLPVPTETEEFDSFRQFVLKVKPENIQGIAAL